MKISELLNESQGVAEGKINPAGLNHTQQIGDYVYRAKALNGSDEGEIEMTAYDGKKSIADTVFMPYGSGGRMISGQTYVHPAYRGKGVAAGMYAYLRMLGFKIEPSGIRTGAGKAMWDKWEKAGDAKHLSQGVAEGRENFNTDLMKPGFRWGEEINGITYLVRTQWDNMPEVIARVNNREVGRATFIDHHTRSGLESVSTYVSPKWQGHGIAKNMYAVIRMLGANIQPSATQTDMGKDMWAKWKKGGDTKHLTSMNAKTDQQGVAESRENFNGIDISMEIQKDDEYVDDEDYDNQVLYVTASSKGKELGHVLFAFDGEYLMPQDLEVEERYRGQGIAQTMYDYVKSKGYKIRRSGQQTDAGAGFWDKHKGPGQNVWEQGVAENFADGKHPEDKGDSARLGIPKHASISSLRKIAHQGGRKGQLAHWQANMRSGHNK